MIPPLKYQAWVLQMLHDGQGHQGIERTTALCRECFYCSTMYKDVAEYVKDCPWCQVAKGPYIGPKTQPGSIIVNGPLDLLCVDFTTKDPSRDGKEYVLVLTDAFSKFSQEFVTPNQKALTMAKIIGDKRFYVYRIPAQMHSDKKSNFLKTPFWSICTTCMGLKNLQPCHTTHVEIPTVRGLTICSMIY